MKFEQPLGHATSDITKQYYLGPKAATEAAVKQGAVCQDRLRFLQGR